MSDIAASSEFGFHGSGGNITLNTIGLILVSKPVPQGGRIIASLDVSLSPEHLQHLNEVSQIELGFPHDFLQNDNIRDRLFGGTFNTIENYRI